MDFVYGDRVHVRPFSKDAFIGCFNGIVIDKKLESTMLPTNIAYETITVRGICVKYSVRDEQTGFIWPGILTEQMDLADNS